MSRIGLKAVNQYGEKLKDFNSIDEAEQYFFDFKDLSRVFNLVLRFINTILMEDHQSNYRIKFSSFYDIIDKVKRRFYDSVCFRNSKVNSK